MKCIPNMIFKTGEIARRYRIRAVDLQKHAAISYPTALKVLADDANITLDTLARVLDCIRKLSGEDIGFDDLIELN
jgi:predicted transcriptional regulator